MIGAYYATALACAALLSASNLAAGQQAELELPEVHDGFPYYMKSPIVQQQDQARITQRTNIPAPPQKPTLVLPPAQPPPPPPPPPPPQPTQVYKFPETAPQQSNSCLYDRNYFARFDQCLERKPYPTIGLAAFKNDDLLVRSNLHDRHGCSFVLTNGLFKHYQLAKYSIDAGDTKCLDDNKIVQMSMQFSNVTLYYLWQLRCLNQADQLLDDATLGGKTSEPIVDEHHKGGATSSSHSAALCVGSSQSFGFVSLQVSQIEAQVELAIDIYKNWRVTNITLAMTGSGPHDNGEVQLREFTFETLDGDELNWRYLNLYENWARNRLHTNFLDQFRRFTWLSLQRCLADSAEKLPVKLVELFGQQVRGYN